MPRPRTFLALLLYREELISTAGACRRICLSDQPRYVDSSARYYQLSHPTFSGRRIPSIKILYPVEIALREAKVLLLLYVRRQARSTALDFPASSKQSTPHVDGYLR